MTQSAIVKEHSRRGEVIANKYRVEGVLGVGGMGIVFLATHLDLDRFVAIKIMRTELAQYPGTVERLLLEAKTAARLRSEHVCRVLDVGTLPEGVPFVVMEYLEGSDLAAQLSEQGPFDVALAVDLMLEACEALAEAHVHQIVHRDLKPENLFVYNEPDGSPIIKVLDFGISKQVGTSVRTSRSLTNPSAALGSPNYMPPEQMLSSKDVDVRADIWAMGTILYELLTDQPAFDGESVPEVCAAVLSSEPLPVTQLRLDLPEGLSGVITCCLAKNRDDRYANVAEFAAALAPFGSGKALLSVARIERVLSGRPGTIKGTPSNPVMNDRPRPVSQPGSNPNRGVPSSLSPTLTTGAPVAFSERPKRRNRVVMAVAFGVIATLGFIITVNLTGRHASPAAVAAVAAPVTATTSRALTETPAAAVAEHVTEESAAAPSASALPSTSGSTVPGGQTAPPPRARPAVATPRPSGKVPAAPGKPAQTTAPADAKTGAWDMGTFGPRQ